MLTLQDRCGLLALLLLGSCGGAKVRDSLPAHRNLVLVVVDALRSDHLSSYGYGRDTAPRLAELAAGGAQVQGWAASSWTKPAVATLLSGRYPRSHGAIDRVQAVAQDVPLLAELLAEEGWATAGYSSNRYAGGDFGFSRGHRSWHKGVLPRPGLEPRVFGLGGEHWKAPAAWVTAVGLDLAAELESPYFLSLHYLDPHQPLLPRCSWDGRCREQELVQARADGIAEEDSLQAIVDQYDGAIRDVDLAVAELLGGLELRGLLSDALVVVTADHGEELGERGSIGHGRTLEREVLEVPLIWWTADRSLGPCRTDAPFHHVDVLPTILEAIGARARPAGIDGRSRWAELLAGCRLGPAGAPLFELALDGVESYAALGDHQLLRLDRQCDGKPSWSAELVRWPPRSTCRGTGGELVAEETSPSNRNARVVEGTQRGSCGEIRTPVSSRFETLVGEPARALSQYLRQTKRSGLDGALDAEGRAELSALGYAAAARETACR